MLRGQGSWIHLPIAHHGYDFFFAWYARCAHESCVPAPRGNHRPHQPRDPAQGETAMRGWEQGGKGEDLGKPSKPIMRTSYVWCRSWTHDPCDYKDKKVSATLPFSAAGRNLQQKCLSDQNFHHCKAFNWTPRQCEIKQPGRNCSPFDC